MLSWVILAIGQSAGNGYFTALFIFGLPLLMDYLKFVPDTRTRKCFRSIGIFVSGFWAFLGFVGAIGVLEVVTVSPTNTQLIAVVTDKFLVFQGATIPLSYIWISVGITVVLTFVDWILWESNAERTLRTAFREEVGVEQ